MAKLADADRKSPFEDFRIGEPRVGHVNLHRARAGTVGRRAAAAADRFVVAERRVAEEQIVHRALARAGESQRAQQHVDHALRSLDIAAGDGGSRFRRCAGARIEQALGQHDLDRPQHAVVERNILVTSSRST